MDGPERFRRVEQIFHAAVRLDQDEREAFLDDCCRTDGKLRDEVLSLLSEDASAADLLEQVRSVDPERYADAVYEPFATLLRHAMISAPR